MANQVYNNFKALALSGAFNLFNTGVKMMLCSGNYTFSHNHTITGHITHELAGGAYTRGGQLVPSTTVYIDTVENEAWLSGASVTYTGLNHTLTYGILYISGVNAATSYLIGQVDFGSQTLSNADLTINWNSTEGILNLT